MSQVESSLSYLTLDFAIYPLITGIIFHFLSTAYSVCLPFLNMLMKFRIKSGKSKDTSVPTEYVK